MSSRTYHYEFLPHDRESVTQWAPKFIEFRMNALKVAPKTYSSSYELEAAISQEEWISTLCRPAFRVILCVILGDESPVHLWDNEWAGLTCLYGPQYNEPTDGCLESRWYVGGSFILSIHRGQSLLKKLFFFALQEVRAWEVRLHRQQQFKISRYRTRIQITMIERNDALHEYYQQVGFETSQYMTLKEFTKAGWNSRLTADLSRREVEVMEKINEKEASVMSRL